MIVALMSTYNEGSLALSAARSALPACDALVLYEGPVGEAAAGGDPTPVDRIKEAAEQASVLFWDDGGSWDSDAAKRTALLELAQSLWKTDGEPLWCFWIDGDEILLWGEYLRDHCGRAEHEGGAGGFPLRIVELDGSVALAHGRVFRGDLVAGFEEGSYQVRLRAGMIVALPNVPICDAGGVPCGKADGSPVLLEDLAELRPPLAGEPHVLHRTVLRSPQRQAARLHVAELGWHDDNHSRRV